MEYVNGNLSKIIYTKPDSETFSYSWSGGNITSTTNPAYTIEYGSQKNNMNLDLWMYMQNMINDEHGTAALMGLLGNRTTLLPSKTTGELTTTYTYTSDSNGRITQIHIGVDQNVTMTISYY